MFDQSKPGGIGGMGGNLSTRDRQSCRSCAVIASHLAAFCKNWLCSSWDIVANLLNDSTHSRRRAALWQFRVGLQRLFHLFPFRGGQRAGCFPALDRARCRK